MVSVSFGSNAMSRTPRGEQVSVFWNSARLPRQSFTSTEPLWMNDHVAPPSVVLYRPHLAAPGTGRVTPEQQTELMPRSAVVDATYIVSGAPGTIRISPTPLPANSASPIGRLQV